MKQFVFGTIIGTIVGVLIQDKWNAKKTVSEKAGDVWDYTKKKIDSLKEDVKENIEDLKEEVSE